MTMKYWLGGPIVALALGLVAGTAQAGPVGTATTALKASAEAGSVIEKIAYRRCWWRAGKRHCRGYRYAGYRYYAPYQYYGSYYSSGSGIGPISGIRY